MAVNLAVLYERLPEGWLTESELEAVIGRIASIPDYDGAARSGAVTMLANGGYIKARPLEGGGVRGAWEYLKNADPPPVLSFMEAEQARLDRAGAQEQAWLKREMEIERAHDEQLNGPFRRAEEAAFRARVLGVLNEFDLLPEGTPVPSAPPMAVPDHRWPQMIGQRR